MIEKRKFKRHVVEGVEGSILLPVGITVLDVSLGGARVEVPRRMDIGQTYMFTLKDGGVGVDLHGLVEWAAIKRSSLTADGDYAPVYHAGVKFTDIKTESGSALEGLIGGVLASRGQRFEGQRFSVSGGVAASLQYPLKFTVRKMSMGGMLIEGAEPFRPDDLFHVEVRGATLGTLRFTGRVASCIRAGEHGARLYHVGVEFKDLTPEGKAALSGFLAAFE